MILICAATVMELDACLAASGERFEALPAEGGQAWVRTLGGHLLAATGVGIPLTLARLLPLASARKPELIVDVGIAGAYPGSGLGIGDLAAAESEVFGDLGMETPGPEAFLPLGGMPWADDLYRRPLPLLLEPFRGEGFPRPGKGCTVNACAGRAETGKRRRDLFAADFETMEGAAVALAARELAIPACELRAISNFASDRDMRPENMALALGNLGVYMDGWLRRNA